MGTLVPGRLGRNRTAEMLSRSVFQQLSFQMIGMGEHGLNLANYDRKVCGMMRFAGGMAKPAESGVAMPLKQQRRAPPCCQRGGHGGARRRS